MPAISVTGTEDWLGEWTFALPQGSMTDEPIFWAQLLAKGGHADGRVPRSSSRSSASPTSGTSARRAARSGMRIVAEEWIPQTAQDVERGCRRAPRGEAGCARALRLRLRRRLRESGAGGARLGPAPLHGHRLPERLAQRAACGTRWSAGPGSTSTTRGTRWARASSTSSRPAYGRRPEYCVPVVNRDLATVLLHAFADAHPLSPRGVKEALERVKMLPAASGAPGTLLSFGKWMRRGWMGAGYLVARQLDPDRRQRAHRRTLRPALINAPMRRPRSGGRGRCGTRVGWCRPLGWSSPRPWRRAAMVCAWRRSAVDVTSCIDIFGSAVEADVGTEFQSGAPPWDSNPEPADRRDRSTVGVFRGVASQSIVVCAGQRAFP